MLAGAASASAATSVAGQVRYAIDNNPNFSSIQVTAQRHEYVILQPRMTDQLHAIKAANPQTKVLMDKDLSASIDYPSNVYLSTGVSYQEANTEHPEWFLRNTSGNRFTFSSYGYLWAMDVGSPSYQQRWADNVLNSVKTLGYDGVFIDDTNPTMKSHYTVSQVAKYPSDAAYQQATESALAYITPRIHAAGYLAVSNIGNWGEYPDVGQRWLQYLDGAMDENFGKWGDTAGSGYAWEGYWNNQLQSLKYAQEHGKDYLAITHSADGDAAAARYGWGTLLLGAQGHANFGLHSGYTTENWFPEYDYDIGEPTGPESRDTNGVHRRQFSNGMVVVNPTGGQLSADLCGGTYSGSGYSHVTSVNLAANRAAILTLDSGSSAGTCTGQSSGGGSTSGGTTSGDGSGTTVQPGKKKIRKGRIVATGRVTTGAKTTLASSSGDEGADQFNGTELSLEVRRQDGGTKAIGVTVRNDGSFVGRVRICQPGSYEIFAAVPGTEEQLPWPGDIRVRKEQLRC